MLKTGTVISSIHQNIDEYWQTKRSMVAGSGTEVAVNLTLSRKAPMLSPTYNRAGFESSG
jgi:hypothetical protein